MKSIDVEEILDIPSLELAFFVAFDQHNVRYVLIGGTAVRFHGYLRNVNDVDVVVDNSEENARRVYAALTGVIGPQPFTVNDLRQPKKKLRPHYYCIDVVTSLNGVLFDEAYRDKITVAVSGIPIHIISKPHLILSKKVSAREKDVEDIYELERQGSE